MDWTEDSNRLRAKNDQLKAEIDVVRGTACAEEQQDGNGPCGICITCYERRLHEALSIIEKLSQLTVLSKLNITPEAFALSGEAKDFILRGPGDTKHELERELVRTAKAWADDFFDDDRPLVRVVTQLIEEEKRRGSR